MSIKEFIQTQILLPRLQQTGVLIVYDPDRRYHDLCLALATENRQVVDASEGSLASREAALAALQELGRPKPTLEGLLIYVPAPAPQDDTARQRDPFSIYAACGRLFPEGDGDEYQSLCLKAKPDHATEIRRLFADNPNPDFAVIDRVGGGASWPQLQALLDVESAREILFALLAPTDDQKDALKGQEAWGAEAKVLLQSTLGLRLVTRAKTWGPIAEELWRYLLFSEFVFDLPGDLPPALSDVPHAPPEARALVEDLCDRLRNDRRTQVLYIEHAEAIEQKLRLPEACAAISDLGTRDTFLFEERSFFTQAMDALRRDNIDKLRRQIAQRRHSVWLNRSESQAQWLLLNAAVNLVEACADAERQLPEHSRSQEALIAFYTGSLRETDRLQREFEQAASDALVHNEQMAPVLRQARTVYRRLIDKVQGHFIRHLEREGWPPTGRLANVDLFDKLVAPKLQESGYRVALLLIDALRYELGVELQKQLAEDGQVTVQAAFAQLPTITPVGMAGLLPGAGANLKLTRKDDRLVPVLGDQPLTTLTQRMDLLRKRYGQRFSEAALKDFVRTKVELPGTVELLVLRSNEMDNDFESNPEGALTLIVRTFQQVRTAIHKLRTLGFHEAIIVTDHGFYLNTAATAGDVCARPPGKWLNLHDRLLLGDGAADNANVLFPAEQLGIRGEFSQVALPRAMVAYQANRWYFHGGVSLQEAVVPVLTVSLRPTEEKLSRKPAVTLTYKRGAKRITTRRPVIEVTASAGDLFSLDDAIDILLQAQDKKGNPVGEAMPGGSVNPATGILSIRPGDTVQVPLKMSDDYEGKFIIKAFDPTTLTTYASLNLETDYTV
ncbi:MAG: PglZ domain-containing protein [Chloroflexi bacterium]|nr:MAG: PglZ domain-containing protein [Chloroflexota bacterium]